VDGYDVDIEPDDHLAFLRYVDRPGMVGTIGGILGRADVNIASMQVARETKGGHALMVLSVDSAIPVAVLDEIQHAVEAVSVRAVDLSE
jgi:D-3-phosphoglycerate dehydrogenase / 2-oxoglutarate reductase